MIFSQTSLQCVCVCVFSTKGADTKSGESEELSTCGHYSVRPSAKVTGSDATTRAGGDSPNRKQTNAASAKKKHGRHIWRAYMSEFIHGRVHDETCA